MSTIHPEWRGLSGDYHRWRCTRKHDGSGESVMWKTGGPACGVRAVIRKKTFTGLIPARCERHAIQEGLMNQSRVTTHPEPKFVREIPPKPREFQLQLPSGLSTVTTTVDEATARALYEELARHFAPKLPHVCSTCGSETCR